MFCNAILKKLRIRVPDFRLVQNGDFDYGPMLKACEKVSFSHDKMQEIVFFTEIYLVGKRTF